MTEHEIAVTNGWDTKILCTCRERFASRMEFYQHRGDAYRDERDHALSRLGIERVDHAESEALGRRAVKLVDFMLGQCAPHLTENFGEINEVLVEAHKKGWLE